jgi:hypothetical protein
MRRAVYTRPSGQGGDSNYKKKPIKEASCVLSAKMEFTLRSSCIQILWRKIMVFWTWMHFWEAPTIGDPDMMFSHTVPCFCCATTTADLFK